MNNSSTPPPVAVADAVASTAATAACCRRSRSATSSCSSRTVSLIFLLSSSIKPFEGRITADDAADRRQLAVLLQKGQPAFAAEQDVVRCRQRLVLRGKLSGKESVCRCDSVASLEMTGWTSTTQGGGDDHKKRCYCGHALKTTPRLERRRRRNCRKQRKSIEQCRGGPSELYVCCARCVSLPSLRALGVFDRYLQNASDALRVVYTSVKRLGGTRRVRFRRA